jgi:hypothetical protein
VLVWSFRGARGRAGSAAFLLSAALIFWTVSARCYCPLFKRRRYLHEVERFPGGGVILPVPLVGG